MKSTILILFVVFSMSSPAYSDWQKTKWGMTEDDVRRTVDGIGELPADKRKDWSSPASDARLAAPYRTDEFEFLAIFHFNRSKNFLSQVSLRLAPNHDGQLLLGALIQRYGRASQDSFKVGSTILFEIWKWRSGDDNISLTHWIAEREWVVSYSGLPKGVGEGL